MKPCVSQESFSWFDLLNPSILLSTNHDKGESHLWSCLYPNNQNTTSLLSVWCTERSHVFFFIDSNITVRKPGTTPEASSPWCRVCVWTVAHICLFGLFDLNVAMTMQSPCHISVNSLINILSLLHLHSSFLLLGGTNGEKVQRQRRTIGK